MPQVQYKDQVNNVTITRDMPTPKQITKLTAWYRDARKVIPEIPKLGEGVDNWQVENTAVCTKYVRFNIRNSIGLRQYIVIVRGNTFGSK